MKLFKECNVYRLYNGNMLDMLDDIDEESIGSIVCDPPYELNFMGKGWDNSGIAFRKETWRKCYDVLKPGGYLLAFGGSRTFHRIACAIEDAGFEIRDTIMWLYGSGFPKSMDISKQIDKNNAKSRIVTNEFKNYLNEARNRKNYSLADINRLMEVATTGGGFASSLMGEKELLILPTKENYNKLKKILDLDDRYDEMVDIYEAEREIIGTREKLESYQYKNNNVYQTNGEKDRISLDITIPSTDLAKQWNGWGTCLKPAFEPIIVARKPFDGSLVDNIIENGVGGINIEECRVGNEERINSEAGFIRRGRTDEEVFFGTDKNRPKGEKQVVGRFPSNVILTYDETDEDEVCGGFPTSDKPNGSIAKPYKMNNTVYGDYGYCNTWDAYQDSGSASRYFYCAKASKKDRDEGLECFEDTTKVFNGKSSESSKDIKDVEARFTTVAKNFHPTVKPTELMQYLVRLVTPKGETVLDPFMGSGSTGKAVMYENKEHSSNYKFIGIELNQEYVEISAARIYYACNDDYDYTIHNEIKKPKQKTLF